MLIVLGLAKILRAKQLLRANDLRAVSGCAFGGGQSVLQVRGEVRRAGGLNQPYLDDAINHLRTPALPKAADSTLGRIAQGGSEMLGAARGGLDVGPGNRQAKQLADELAQGLVGRTVPRVINVMLQVVEQLTAALIPLAQFARQRA